MALGTHLEVIVFRKSPPRAAAQRAVEAIEARMRPNFRRALWTGVVCLAAFLTASELGGLRAHSDRRFVVMGLAAAFATFGIIAVRSAASEAARVSALRGGASTATAVRLGVTVAGLLIVLLGTLDLLNVRIERLLLGGAITGVVVGIAAQQSLGNLAAGIVMLVSRPFYVGEHVRVRAGSLGGVLEGTITSIGLVYTSLDTDEGPVAIPNSGLLGAAVLRVRQPDSPGLLYPGDAGAVHQSTARHTLVGRS